MSEDGDISAFASRFQQVVEDNDTDTETEMPGKRQANNPLSFNTSQAPGSNAQPSSSPWAQPANSPTATGSTTHASVPEAGTRSSGMDEQKSSIVDSSTVGAPFQHSQEGEGTVVPNQPDASMSTSHQAPETEADVNLVASAQKSAASLGNKGRNADEESSCPTTQPPPLSTTSASQSAEGVASSRKSTAAQPAEQQLVPSDPEVAAEGVPNSTSGATTSNSLVNGSHVEVPPKQVDEKASTGEVNSAMGEEATSKPEEEPRTIKDAFGRTVPADGRRSASPVMSRVDSSPSPTKSQGSAGRAKSRPGRQRDVAPEGRTGARSPPLHSRIFIGNLACERVNKGQLRKMFGKYGKVLEISLHKSFGFIQFDRPESAKMAMEGETGKVLAGLTLDISLATHRPGGKKPRTDQGPKRPQQQRDRGRGMPPHPRERRERFSNQADEVRGRDYGRTGVAAVGRPGRDRSPIGRRPNARMRSRSPPRERMDRRRPVAVLSPPSQGPPAHRPSRPAETHYPVTQVPARPVESREALASDCVIIIVDDTPATRESADTLGLSLADAGLNVDSTLLPQQQPLSRALEDLRRDRVPFACVIADCKGLRQTVDVIVQVGPGRDFRDVFLAEATRLLRQLYADLKEGTLVQKLTASKEAQLAAQGAGGAVQAPMPAIHAQQQRPVALRHGLPVNATADQGRNPPPPGAPTQFSDRGVPSGERARYETDLYPRQHVSRQGVEVAPQQRQAPAAGYPEAMQPLRHHQHQPHAPPYSQHGSRTYTDERHAVVSVAAPMPGTERIATANQYQYLPQHSMPSQAHQAAPHQAQYPTYNTSVMQQQHQYQQRPPTAGQLYGASQLASASQPLESQQHQAAQYAAAVPSDAHSSQAAPAHYAQAPYHHGGVQPGASLGQQVQALPPSYVSQQPQQAAHAQQGWPQQQHPPAQQQLNFDDPHVQQSLQELLRTSLASDIASLMRH